jgi:hypothetical protein
MNIFSEEFKTELSSQLEAITNIVKKDNSNGISDLELIKAMEDSFNNSDCDKKEDSNKSNKGLHEEFKLVFKKEKKKKNKEFKEGDFVYLENLSGEIVLLDKKRNLIVVEFFNGAGKDFYIDGSIVEGGSKLLSHYPYELKIKKLKQ